MTDFLVQLSIPVPANLPFERTAEMLEAVRNIDVTNDESYVAIAELLQRVKRLGNDIEAERKLLKGPVDEAARTVQAFFRAPTETLLKAEEMAKAKISKYQREQERIRREAQRLEDEKAERERQRLAKIAANNNEKARLLAEQGRAADAAKAQARADAAEEKGAFVVPPIIDREPPKVAGIASREVWKAEVTSLMELVQAIADGKAPLSLVMPNDKVIGQQARSLQKDFITPGIRVWSEKQIAAGSR